MKYPGIREEAVKTKVAADFFDKFDATDILKNVDFAVKFRGDKSLLGDEYLLWAEAKDGRSDIYASFVQLILTIGQSGTVDNLLPPPFLGAFDSEKLAKFFVVPADTFDNVSGAFPIGFFVWDTAENVIFERVTTDIYNSKGGFEGEKTITTCDDLRYISEWLELCSKNISKEYIGHLASVGNDFQNQRMIFIDDMNAKRKKGSRRTERTTGYRSRSGRSARATNSPATL